MPATEKQLEEVEALIISGEVKKRWIIVPYPIKGRMEKHGRAFTRADFVKAVIASRVLLIHDDWAKCCEDARTLSGTGGIQRVLVSSVTTPKTRIAAEYRDGNAVKVIT